MATGAVNDSRNHGLRWVLAAGGMAVVCAALVVAFQRAPRSGTTAGGTPSGELEALRGRLRELEAEQERQRGVSRLLWKSNSEQLAAQEAAGANPEAHREPSAEPVAAPPTAHERYEALEARFSEEPQDLTWSRRTEVEVAAVVGRFAQTKLSAVSCRSTMCRLELEFPNREAREEYEVSHVTEAPFLGANVWTQRSTQADGSLRTVEIVSRSGALPEG